MAFDDFRSNKTLDDFQNALYDKLRTRKRAMMNWQKVKLVLAVIKLAGNRLERPPAILQAEEEQ